MGCDRSAGGVSGWADMGYGLWATSWVMVSGGGVEGVVRRRSLDVGHFRDAVS